jgi:3-oxoacyl-[acyl-carrier protein] reductase
MSEIAQAEERTTLPLAGKVAVVVGGTGGIGKAAARHFAKAGATIVIGYNRHADEAKTLSASLSDAPHRALYAPMENTPALRQLAAHVDKIYGRADILVNAAGFTRVIRHRDLEALDDDLIDAIFIANWRGPFAIIRALAPLLQASGDGLIVNISSMAAANGSGSNIAYGAAKAALNTMTKSLARALAPTVRVLAVSPAAVATEFVPGRDADWNASYAKTVPLKRIATADDIALAVLACATHLRYSTGCIIAVDGGRML